MYFGVDSRYSIPGNRKDSIQLFPMAKSQRIAGFCQYKAVLQLTVISLYSSLLYKSIKLYG